MVNRKEYRPFGKFAEWGLPDVEDKAFLGEYYDRDSELSYLNARYSDPKLGMFIQPDWFEVTEPGVGTNRYSYCFNDPINCIDPNGNDALRQNEDGTWTSSDVSTYDPETGEASYDKGKDQYPDYRAQQEVDIIVKLHLEFDTPDHRKSLAAASSASRRSHLLNQGIQPWANGVIAGSGVSGIIAASQFPSGAVLRQVKSQPRNLSAAARKNAPKEPAPARPFTPE